MACGIIGAPRRVNYRGSRRATMSVRFQGDIEYLLLRPRPVIGEIKALIDQGVDIDRPVLRHGSTFSAAA